MKRRTFAKLLGLGTGPFGLWQTAGGTQKTESVAGAGPTIPPPLPPTRFPINVLEYEALARGSLPRPNFDYLSTGSEDEVTLRDNLEAFGRIRLLPPVLHGIGHCDLSTTVLGEPVSIPVMLAPVVTQGLFHPEGELASARAAASHGTVFGVSTGSTYTVEDIAAAGKGPLWFQLYFRRDREVTRGLLQRVEQAGFKTVVLTVDRDGRKEQDMRNRFTLPQRMLYRVMQQIGHDLPEKMSNEELYKFANSARDPGLTWEIFDWLRSVTRLPLLAKGIVSPSDARKAVSAGLDGIIVSNHGGRALDGMPATIDALEEIVRTVDGRLKVFMDGGFRRGRDVLKALALGARAVLIGRPYAWGLATAGKAGVHRVLEIFREEVQNALVTCACARISDVHKDLLLRG